MIKHNLLYKQYVFTNRNNMKSMFYPFKPTSEFTQYQLSSNKGNFIVRSLSPQELIKPEIIFSKMSFIEYDTPYFQEFFEAFKSYVENFTKEFVIYGIAEEISKYFDEELKSKIIEDKYLNKVLINSFIKIKKYLEKKDKRYELKAFVWHDIENGDWEENIISLKIECKDNKEKRKIWDEIDKIVKQNEDQGIVILTDVDKYELS